jgi:transcriptional regulator with XRE-family HTH domain
MPTMGEVLREARYRLNVSLEQAEANTRVRKKYLTALEEDDYAELPAPVYARGFLQIYAEFLGVEPSFVDKLYLPPQPRVTESRIRPAATGIPASGGFSMRGIVTFLLSAMGIGAIFLLYWQYAAFTSSPGEIMSGPPSAVTTPTTYVVAAAVPTATPTVLPTPSPTPVRGVEVVVTITERSWMRVTADGATQPLFEGELQTGDTRTWKAKDRIEMRVGNAAGVEVTVNGMRQGKLGANGEVKNVSWGRQ